MGFRLFRVKYVLFEEFDDGIKAKQGAKQAQEEHRKPLS